MPTNAVGSCRDKCHWNDPEVVHCLFESVIRAITSRFVSVSLRSGRSGHLVVLVWSGLVVPVCGVR